MKTKEVRTIGVVLGSLFILALYITTIYSGYHYQFDIDEYYHAQIAYQIGNQGLTPYLDFFLLYTPVFHYMVVPFYTALGWTIETMMTLRGFMVVLFTIRMIVGWFAVKELFGKGVSLVFVIMLLLEAFHTFSAMQVRPDIPMMLFLMIGLLLLIRGVKQKKPHMMAGSGAMMALSVITHIKTLPTIVALSLVIGVYALVTRQHEKLAWYVLGGLGLTIVFFVPFVMMAAVPDMLQQVIRDPSLILASLQKPAIIGDMYRSGNPNVFGFWGRPAPWVYIWMLPAVGGMGAYWTLQQKLGIKKLGWDGAIKLGLVAALAAQWAWLFRATSVFLQYYASVSWLSALFGAVAVSALVVSAQRHRVVGGATVAAFVILAVIFGYTTIRANLNRATYTGAGDIEMLHKRWEIVPEDAYVFPSMLFRPLAHPLGTGAYYEMPRSLKDRYEPIGQTLEQKQVPFIFQDDFNGFTVGEAIYIQERYKQFESDKKLWQRVN